MKRTFIFAVLGVLTLLFCLQAQRGGPPSASADLSTLEPLSATTGSINFNAIAILRWYAANLTAGFSVGNGPQGVAFDGADVWVANSLSNNVTKLRGSDGAVLGTFAAGSGPHGLVFDGANIWVANQLSNNVTKLRASDGALLGTFAAGVTPTGVVFDGANIWVTNTNSNSTSKM